MRFWVVCVIGVMYNFIRFRSWAYYSLFLFLNKSSYDVMHCGIDRIELRLVLFDSELTGAVLYQVAMLMVGTV